MESELTPGFLGAGLPLTYRAVWLVLAPSLLQTWVLARGERLFVCSVSALGGRLCGGSQDAGPGVSGGRAPLAPGVRWLEGMVQEASGSTALILLG